jgi:hypothetical protein
MGFSLDRLGTLSLSNGPPLKDVIELPAQNTKEPGKSGRKKAQKAQEKRGSVFCAFSGGFLAIVAVNSVALPQTRISPRGADLWLWPLTFSVAAEPLCALCG